MRISPGSPPYDAETSRLLMDKVLAKVRNVGGVESLAMASGYPFNPGGVVQGPRSNAYQIKGRPLANGQAKPNTDILAVMAGYFETLRQPIVEGRSFTAHDNEPTAKAVVIINQAMARHQFPAEDPIGKLIQFDGDDQWREIVGVAGDVKEYGLDHPPIDEIYGPVQQNYVGRLVVRTAADPRAVAPMVRAAVHDLDPQLAIDQVDTVERAEYDSMASPRVMTFLLGIFAGLAVLISASGLAAVMALSVSQRTREIGVRMALGAKRGAIVGMVVKQGLTLATVGAVLGLAGAAALSNLLASLLYGTSPTDLATFCGVLLLFLLVAALACFIPARQVTAIDPLEALRQE